MNSSASAPAAPAKPYSKYAEILFWILAVLMLFLNLDIGGLRGSEGRWADVVRIMFLTGDFMHPVINFEPYFDKPLLSYWAIAAGGVLTGGEVTELLIRIPSALAGLVSLWATRLIAARYAGKTTGIIAGWILLTVYSFPFWGRLGEADMLNLAFGTLAIGWYVLNREKNDLRSYLVFGLLCAIGGQTKGLSSVAVPVLAVLADLALSKSWKRHLNWKICVAGVISLGVYLIPFLLASLKKDYSDNGLQLVFQENIQRYFNSLDHKQKWYAYFIHLPQLFLPWTPILILALIASVKNWKTVHEADRWLLVSIGLIFLVFSISDSKRVYYILPILPFCAVLTARFILSEGNTMLEKIRDIVLKIYGWMVPALVVFLLVLVGYGWIRRAKYLKKASSPEQLVQILAIMLLSALILLVVWLIFRRQIPASLFPAPAGKDFALASVCAAIVLIGFFGIVMPQVSETSRTEKKFFTAIRQYLDSEKIPTERVYFFHHNYTNPSFYLKRTRPITVLDHEKGAENAAETAKELQELLKDRSAQPAVIIGQLRYFRKIQSPALRKRLLDSLKWTEPSGSWENPKKNGKKYAAIILK